MECLLLLEELNHRLKKDCPHLKNTGNPILSVLWNTNFTYPFYFALCNTLKTQSPADVANALGELYPPLKYTLPEMIPEAARYLSYNTLLYCGYHAESHNLPDSMFFNNVGLRWEDEFQRAQEARQVENSILCLQNELYPFAKDLRQFYAWNPNESSWFVLKREKLEAHLHFVFGDMKELRCYTKIAPHFQKHLDSDCWVTPYLDDLIDDLIPVQGNTAPRQFSQFRRIYGLNVPEYYFFERYLDMR